MNTSALKTELDARGLRMVDVARAFGVDKAAVTRWNMFQVPVERIRKMQEVFGIPPHKLRPDIFPAPAVSSERLPAVADAAHAGD